MAQKEDNSDHTFKMLILGDCEVGKTSLLSRFIDDGFSKTYVPTLGIDFRRQSLEIDNTKVKLQIWDTSGHERFSAIMTAFFEGANGVLLVYDVTNVESFSSIENWAEEVCLFCDSGASRPCMILLGNRSDLEAEKTIQYSQGKELATKLGIPFLETSAKLNTNVEQAFIALAVKMKNRALTEESNE